MNQGGDSSPQRSAGRGNERLHSRYRELGEDKEEAKGQMDNKEERGEKAHKEKYKEF